MKSFFKVIGVFLALLVTAGVIGVGLYFTVPKVKEWADTHILKQEQTNDTSKDEEIATLTEQLEEKETLITNITTSLNEQKALVSRLQASAEADAETIARLQLDISAKETELQTLQADKVSLQEQITELEADITENENQISTLQNNNTELADQIEELEEDLLANSTTISELNATISQNNTKIAEIEADNTTKATEIENLNTRLSEKNLEITEIQNQVITLTTERDNALASLTETQEQLDAALSKIKLYEDELNSDISKIYLAEVLTSDGFLFCQIDEDEYLIYPKVTNGFLYLFNSINYELKPIANFSTIKSFTRLSNGDVIIITGYSNITDIYLKETREVLTLSGVYHGLYSEFACGKVLFVQSETSSWIYDMYTHEVEVFSECNPKLKTGSAPTKLKLINDHLGYFVQMYDSNLYGFVNLETKEYIEITASSNFGTSSICFEYGDDVYYSYSNCIYKVDFINKSFESVYSGANNLTYRFTLPNGNAFISFASSYVIWNPIDGVVFEGDAINFDSFIKTSDNNYILYVDLNVSTTNSGIGLFNSDDYTFTSANIGKKWSYHKTSAGDVYFYTYSSAQNNDYLLTYSTIDKTLVVLTEKGYVGFDVMIELPNNKLLFSSILDPYVCVFDKETSTIEDISTDYFLTDVCVIDETGVTIRASKKTSQKEYIKLRYDFDSGDLLEI